MEIRLEAAEGCNMPVGSFLAVKLGDVLKQGRYEPTRTYQFADADKRRHAKIDLFKHVGSSVVLVSPDAGPNVSEVFIQSGDPLIENLRLKVDVKPHISAKNKVAEPVKQSVRNSAQTYLSKHGIEEKISRCVKLLLQQQPDDPIEFICCHLRGTPYPPPPVTVAAAIEHQLQVSRSTTLPNPPLKSVGDAASQPEESARGLPVACQSRESASDLSTQVPACQLDGALRVDSEPLATVAEGADEPPDVGTRMLVRDALHKASCDGTLLKELQAVSTCSQAPESPAAAIAPESPAAAIAPQSPPIQAPESPAAAIAPQSPAIQAPERPQSPAISVQKALAEASLDGSLVQAMGSGSSKQDKIHSSDSHSRLSQVSNTYAEEMCKKTTSLQANVGGDEDAADTDLAVKAQKVLSEASRDGRLLKALQEMDPTEQKPHQDLAFKAQKVLSEASLDGRLMKALQEMDPAPPSTTSLANASQADTPGGYDLGALRMNLTNDFVKASKDGRLATVLSEGC